MTPPNFLDGKIIQFRVPGVSQIAHGYEATVLIEICDLYLQARDEGKLKGRLNGPAVTAGIAEPGHSAYGDGYFLFAPKVPFVEEHMCMWLSLG